MANELIIETDEQETLQQPNDELQLFDQMVTKEYLLDIGNSAVKELPDDIEQYSGIRWCKINKIIIEKNVFFADKLSMLYMALHKTARNVILVLNKPKDGDIELYLGARDFDGNKMVSGDILEAGLKGYFPGVGYSSNPINEIKFETPSVSAVSAIASLRDDKKENFVQGLERLVNSTCDIPRFCAYFVAENVEVQEVNDMIMAFNNLYTNLSPTETIQRTYSESESQGISESLTKNFSESIGESISKTVTQTAGYSESKTRGHNSNKGSNVNRATFLSPLKTLFGGKQGTGTSKSSGKSYSRTKTQTFSDSETTQEGSNKSTTQGTSEQTGTNETKTQGISNQITYKNRSVKYYLDILDKQLGRLQNGRPFGLWNVATYFVANDSNTAQQLANIYRGAVVGEESNLEICAINTWEKDAANKIRKYLSCGIHPIFNYNAIDVSAGLVVNSKELAIHMSLPQSSIPGLLVREEETFGRNITSDVRLDASNSIELGVIRHLGRDYENDTVRLGIDGLSKHTFVTGTTGSGKSNTMYLIVSDLLNRGTKFMVIEPAKGEYKEVFGNQPDVTVYGSNPKISKLLTINPFEFPENIDVYEHIDSLVEIFSACWPMYAAMPQVLKHSIIEAYKSCGWDMEQSCNPYGIYPTINDVLDALKNYINSSEYSSDTKGDYKGSLETRLQSLCEGLIGRMFGNQPIPDEQLFNENVIIDLSRVNASETKSLLMGLLVLKLNEFRKEEGGMNRDLRHITILEEAHNLLKRTSTEQVAESSNIAGMAVEKIANSMAEMRTYGEGFIVVDQSPSLLDLATIRNTNTKIIMALPEKDDRIVAGKSIGLDDKHIEEISRLKTGEAIVYQNGWEEPVKAKINKYEMSVSQWTYDPEVEKDAESVYDELYKAYTMCGYNLNAERFVQKVAEAKVSGGQRVKIKELLDSAEQISVDDIAKIFATIIGDEIIGEIDSNDSIENQNALISRSLYSQMGLRTKAGINTYVNMYIKGCSLILGNCEIYDNWIDNTLNIK